MIRSLRSTCGNPWPDNPVFVGIEIGGTKLQVGVGAGDGKIVDTWRGIVDRTAGAAGILQQIVDSVPQVLDRARLDRQQIRGVGIGFGGPIDDATRGVLKSHQVSGWDGFPLAEWAETALGWPCAIGNDADVAGLGEALLGAGAGLSPIFYMTIGSGIGGGLITDQRIFRGAGKGAAEVGHLRMTNPDGPPIKLEALCSGWGIESAAAARFGAGYSGTELARRARHGDSKVVDFLSERWAILAEAICSVIALVCPRRIIIGGGISLMGEDLFFEPLRREVAARVFQPFADCYEIVPAALGEEVVVHGALALAKSVF
jgi:glucokinase